MIMRLVEGIFPVRKRSLIIVYKGDAGRAKVLTHPDEATFVLEKRESVITAARFLLRQGFKNIHQDVDIHPAKSFEQDGVENHVVVFDDPLIPDPDVNGFDKLEALGFAFVLIGDHPLTHRIKKAMAL